MKRTRAILTCMGMHGEAPHLINLPQECVASLDEPHDLHPLSVW
jgi:hypothetical protein